MARTFSRMQTAIWGDDDFIALSGDAQWLYFALNTSADLTYCGVTDWRPARLAPRNSDWTPERVVDAALELHKELFVVVDDATEEVMIRSFVKNDGFMESPNIAAAMVREYAAIASKHLRGVLVHELIRLHDSEPELKGWKRAAVLLGNPSVNPSLNPSGWGSVNPSDVVTETLRLTPPSLPTPYSLPLLPAETGGVDGVEPASDRFMDFWSAYPRRVGKGAARRSWEAAVKKGADPQTLVRSAARFAGEMADKDPKYIPHPSTWLNQERYEDEPAEPEASPAPRRHIPLEVPAHIDPDDYEAYAAWLRSEAQ